jgi:hypothetical protein
VVKTKIESRIFALKNILIFQRGTNFKMNISKFEFLIIMCAN